MDVRVFAVPLWNGNSRTDHFLVSISCFVDIFILPAMNSLD